MRAPNVVILRSEILRYRRPMPEPVLADFAVGMHKIGLHKFTATAATVGLTAMLAAPIAHAGDAPLDDPNTATAIGAVLDRSPADALTAIPADFASRFGYRPVIVDGMLVKPSGDCSSPVTLPTEFETACKAHDLGYDLLRYGRVGRWGRKDLDAQLASRMQLACESRSDDAARLGCVAMANIAAFFVAANSWRQDYARPNSEPVARYLLIGVALSALALLVTRLRAWR